MPTGRVPATPPCISTINDFAKLGTALGGTPTIVERLPNHGEHCCADLDGHRLKALPSHATAICGLIPGVLCSFRVHTVDLWIGRLDDFAREVCYGVRRHGPARAFSARTWSPRIGVAVPALTASGACSLQEAKAAVVTSASAARVAATETRSMRRAILTLYGLRMSYSFQPKIGIRSANWSAAHLYIYLLYNLYRGMYKVKRARRRPMLLPSGRRNSVMSVDAMR